jgi:hypothetical protein
MVYSGKVRPHPDLQVALDGQGEVKSSKADLAVVVLGVSLDDIKPVGLSNSELRVNEPVVVVGHGYDEIEDVFDEERRFSESRVAGTTAGADRLLIEQPEGHLYRGDSGGPCFRVGESGQVLAGISSRWLGSGRALTNVYPHRAWILEEIRLAEMVEK